MIDRFDYPLIEYFFTSKDNINKINGQITNGKCIMYVRQRFNNHNIQRTPTHQ